MSRPDLSFACILAVFAAACAPQSAQIVSGNFTAFMASSTSSSILKDEVDPADFDIYSQLDCRQFCAPANTSTPESLCVFESKDEETLLHLPDSILSADDCIALMNINSPEEEGGPSSDYPSTFSGENYAVETWLLQDGYHIVQEELEPWRGEAIINSEGDMQVGFHHRLPGGADFRFDFTINPDFQPTSCRDVVDEAGNPNPDGVTEPVAIDGDWLEEWSGSISEILAVVPADDPRYDLLRKYEDGRLFHINSFAYQFNPDDPQSFDNGLWYLPNEWLAGMTFGKFSEEFLSHRSVRYGEPLLYSTFEATEDSLEVVVSANNVWYCDLPAGTELLGDNGEVGPEADTQCQNPGIGYVWETMPELIDRANAVTQESLDEMAFIEAAGAPQVALAPFIEDNYWRTPDGFAPGLDGWAEMHYNWVVIDASSDISVGGRVDGAFMLTLDGLTSTSRVIVSGEFTSENIRRDSWVSKNLQQEQDVGRCQSAPLIEE